ncbi:MAG: DUF167 domain-containing protein [Deltaproteobacteria bacterium]|nr:DUF167 domain-containing protein [Deltaproteobacteria bacterium]
MLSVRVVPRSARCGYAGVQGDCIKIKIAAPPVEGRANAECIEFLAGLFGVRRDRVDIIGGHSARLKRVFIEGITGKDIERVLDR